MCIHFSLSFGSKPRAKERIGPDFGEQLARPKLFQSSLLSFPIGNSKTANNMRLPKFRKQLAGKIWSNPLCYDFLSVPKKITRYGKSSDNSSPAKFGPILGMCIHFSLSFGSKPRTKERIGTDLGEQLARPKFGPILSVVRTCTKGAGGTCTDNLRRACV